MNILSLGLLLFTFKAQNLSTQDKEIKQHKISEVLGSEVSPTGKSNEMKSMPINKNKESNTKEEKNNFNVVEIITGGLLIVFGLFYGLFGRKLFKITMFFSGMITFTFIDYYVMNYYGLFQSNKIIAYISLPVAALIGGILYLILWKIAYLGLGALAGVFIAYLTYPLLSSFIMEKYLWVYVLGLALIFMIIAFFLEKFSIIILTSFSGSSLLLSGIDCFVRTGSFFLIKDIDSASIPITFNLWMTLGQLAAFIVFATFQFTVWGLVKPEKNKLKNES